MTIEITVNKTIQSGNGSNKDFDFAFEIPDEDSLSLTKRGSDGTETAITTNFTVTGIGDEAGGTVNYPTSGSALASNEKIIIKRVVALKQPKNLRNQGDYSLEDIEDALDRAVMLCQQLQEQIDRSLKLPLTSSSTYVTVDDFVANKLLYVSSDGAKVKMSDADFGSIQTYLATLVAISANITTVAGISANVTTVAGIAAAVSGVNTIAAAVSGVYAIDDDVVAVAAIAAAVSAVNSNSANINTVAGIAAVVTSFAAIAANVSTVAGISANVTTVAGMESNIASVVANMASILNAASFGFPTLASGDEGKLLRINPARTGYLAFNLPKPTVQRFTSGSGTYNKNYVFVITSGSATIGATYTNNGITYTVYATVASATQVVMSGSGAPTTSGTLTKASGTGDSTLTFSSVIAPLYLIVEMVGAGGGGGGGGTGSPGTGGTGGSTTFGSSLLTATGGIGGTPAAISSSVAGGVPTVASPAEAIISIAGGRGTGGNSFGVAGYATGMPGGASALGGNGASAANAAGSAGVTNTGGGGGGGGSNATGGGAGGGGGAGAYLKAIIPNPSAQYSYAVGAAGSAGAAGTNGFIAGVGGSGYIAVTEYYQ